VNVSVAAVSPLAAGLIATRVSSESAVDPNPWLNVGRLPLLLLRREQRIVCLEIMIIDRGKYWLTKVAMAVAAGFFAAPAETVTDPIVDDAGAGLGATAAADVVGSTPLTI
jgi:hypothetical protein